MELRHDNDKNNNKIKRKKIPSSLVSLGYHLWVCVSFRIFYVEVLGYQLLDGLGGSDVPSLGMGMCISTGTILVAEEMKVLRNTKPTVTD
jgi:hypothetical protein